MTTIKPERKLNLKPKVEEKLTLSVAECAKLMGLGITLTYEAVARGEIPSIKVGRRYLIPKAALMKKLAEAGEVSGGAV